MYDPPMHSMDGGIQYIVEQEMKIVDYESFHPTPQCWKCGGSGRLAVKSSKADTADSSSTCENGVVTFYRECSICRNEVKFPPKDSGVGTISKFVNYAPTGPLTLGDCSDPKYHPRKGETLCSLSGHYMIYQYKKGHRFTTDDVCTAYFAYTEMKDVLQNKVDDIAEKMRALKLSSETNFESDSAKLDRTNDSSTKRAREEVQLNHQFSSHLDLGCGLGSVLMMLKWKFRKNVLRSVGVEAQSANLDLARRSIIFNGLEVSECVCECVWGGRWGGGRKKGSVCVCVYGRLM